MKLLLNGLFKYVAGLTLVALFTFLPAGSFEYYNGWLFIALLFIPMLFLGAVLFVKSPELLKKRLDAKEKNETQKAVVKLSGLLFVLSFLTAGLDFRFGWSSVPKWTVILASVTLIVSYALYAEVMRENAYLSRTVEVQEGQKVVDCGLYGVVRHPMYGATVLLFLSIPVVLGSWIAFVVMLPYIPIIAVRIKDEEKVLEKGLTGYSEYKERVRYRLIPFIW